MRQRTSEIDLIRDCTEASLLKFASVRSSFFIKISESAFIYANRTPIADENWLWAPHDLSRETLINALDKFNAPFIMPEFPSAKWSVSPGEFGLFVNGCFSAMIFDFNSDKMKCDELFPLELTKNSDARLWAHLCWNGFDDNTNNVNKNGIIEEAPDEFVKFAENVCGVVDLFTAYDKGTPIGTALISTNESAAGLFYLAVLPQYRRQGMGTSLMHALMCRVRESSPCMTLLATQLGCKLYNKIGFRNIAEIPIRSL